ncbi:MAG: hypothetical protein ABSC23_08670 [Bryobacteraceae bacterium]|jgi:hypothetical protein
MSKKQQATDAPKTCEECERWKEVKRKIRISDLLAEAIGAIEAKVRDKELKPTIGDYLKLLQMEQELGEEAPKEITVRWVEPETTSAESPET